MSDCKCVGSFTVSGIVSGLVRCTPRFTARRMLLFTLAVIPWAAAWGAEGTAQIEIKMYKMGGALASPGRPGDHGQTKHQAKFVLGLLLQRPGRASGRGGALSRIRAAAQPHDRRDCHEPELRIGDRQCVALAQRIVVKPAHSQGSNYHSFQRYRQCPIVNA